MIAFLILLAGISSFVLGLISLRQRNRPRISFSIFSFTVASWILFNFIFQITRNETLVRSFYALGSLAISSGLVFVFYFLFRKIKFLVIIITIALGLLNFVISLFTDLVVENVKEISDTGYNAITGPYFIWYSLYIIIGVITFFIVILVKRRKEAGIKRYQMNYIFLGFGAFGIVMALVSFILPLLGIWSFTSLDSPSALFFVLGSFYAITKHRLLDIRLIILRTITYSLVVLFVSTIFVGLSFLLLQVLQREFNATTILLGIGISVFIVITLDPLKKYIAKATDAIFYKGRIDYGQLLSELSEIINREIDIDVLLHTLSVTLEKELKVKNISIYIASRAGGAFMKRKGRISKGGEKIKETPEEELKMEDKDLTDKLAHTSPLVKYLNKENQIIVLEGLERKIEDTSDEKFHHELEKSKEELDRLDAAVVAPVNIGNKLNAVMVLGPKLSGDPFGNEDISLLELLGPQLASALDKSRLYDEVKQFSERLKKEIAMATEDLRSANVQLQERNRFLSVLQNVTNLITRSLDFKKVTQAIVDSIATELGFIGGILLLLDEERKKLSPQAVTQNKLTNKVIKLLPKPVTDYWGDFEKEKTRSIKAVKTGKVQIGHKFSDFIYPPVPKEFCERIQDVLDLKTIIGVPIFSEDKNIGVIDFLLAKEEGGLKETDLQMMKALANQTGIVAQNIGLYQKLQKSNKELAEANRHLKQLDQAKSEFVSIASHQLRTPMTGIMGYLSMLVDGDYGKVSQEQNEILIKLLDESQRMIRLINLFLNVTKIESGRLTLEKKPTHPEEMIEKVIEMAKKLALEKNLTLQFIKPEEPLPILFIDPDKISDVLLNLIDNAIKYTEKGKVTIFAEKVKNEIKISVKDTGRGIETHEAQDLFNKFVRGYGIAQINPDGSGLGLYVARRITEAHGGKIWVESKGLGKGSVFIFTIPIK